MKTANDQNTIFSIHIYQTAIVFFLLFYYIARHAKFHLFASGNFQIYTSNYLLYKKAWYYKWRHHLEKVDSWGQFVLIKVILGNGLCIPRVLVGCSCVGIISYLNPKYILVVKSRDLLVQSRTFV